MGENKKNIGLALCTGCSIGDCLDVDQLISVSEDAQEGLITFKHAALCSEAGLEALHGSVHEHAISRLAVAACSPRAKVAEFTLDGIYVDRINLREQVSWVMEPKHEDTQMCAEDQTRMVLAKLNAINDNTPYIPETLYDDVLVLGAGISGLTAALEGAESGRKIHLIEKSSSLGGYAGRHFKVLPSEAQATPLAEPNVGELAQKVRSHPNVNIYMETTLHSIAGEPGSFTVRLKDGKDTVLGVGAVVTSTGWKPYEANRLSHLGYGSDGVKTLEEFESFVQKDAVPDRVLFLLCAGSRDENHLSYCSSYCCTAALKQALYVREKNPNALVFIVYRDIRTLGFQEEFYKRVQSDDAIFMTKGLVESVQRGEKGIEVVYQDLALAENLNVYSNIFLGREKTKKSLGLFNVLDHQYMFDESQDILKKLDIKIPSLRNNVRSLSGGQRQAVAISRSIYWNAKLLIMDEPTAALGVAQQHQVLDLVKSLKNHGIGIIIISHQMRDVFAVADRIVVMRRGEKVGDLVKEETSTDEVVNLIVGSETVV